MAANPDVAAVVESGGLASGLQHYLGIGETEGRSLFPGSFDEQWYRQRYPDIVEAISQGVFTSGLEHYLAFGRAEQRSVSPLFELDYFDTYPDVRSARDAGGIYLSAADHYSVAGQFEGRQTTFSGTTGNDTVVGGAALDTLTGVQLDVGQCFVGGTLVGGQCREYDSIGVNEQDVLIGGPGIDTFELGRAQGGRAFVNFLAFYQGGGESDFARIENFEPGRDRLLVAGQLGAPDILAPGVEFETSPEGVKVYSIDNVGVGVPTSRDLVAIIAGIGDPNDVLNSTTFINSQNQFAMT
ncbi:MAG: hypothetical protein ACFCBU_08290 [Cyanophyceae cyanobacterium]